MLAATHAGLAIPGRHQQLALGSAHSSSSSMRAAPPSLAVGGSRLPPVVVAAASSRPLQQRRRAAAVRVAAAGGRGPPSSPPGSPSSTTTTEAASTSGGAGADDEARIEALEASTRKSKSKAAARRQIPIRNVTPRPSEDAASNMAEWREGALFPEGWDDMPLGQKLSELYLGRRGMIFWANKLAWGAVIALGGAWVLFRVGGAIGLYKLQGDLTMPPL